MKLDPSFHFGTGKGTCCGKPLGTDAWDIHDPCEGDS